jgi:hypothetical protein
MFVAAPIIENLREYSEEEVRKRMALIRPFEKGNKNDHCNRRQESLLDEE